MNDVWSGETLFLSKRRIKTVIIAELKTPCMEKIWM